MDKSILLHCITSDELKQIIKEALKEEFIDLKKSLANKDYDILLSRAETCELLKINNTTLWHWTKKGKVTSYGIGNRRYYKREEILSSLILLKQ